MQKRLLLFLFFILLVSCTPIEEQTTFEAPTININNSFEEENNIIEPEESSPTKIIGPNGCTGEDCDEYFKNNPEESQKWCNENPETCNLLRKSQGFEGPNGCVNDCEEFCDTNEQVCKEWCESNPEKNLDLCGFILLEDSGPREGDGVWEKDELTFFIKDEEKVLSNKKREIIIGTITSIKESNGGFYGWNSALQELNRKYQDNKVPDRLIETKNEQEADILIRVHSVKEFCCDLTGDPITGKERSTIDENDTKLKSNVDAYNIINIDEGFLEDLMRHELGHTLGIFSHVTSRKNDLMSIVSPASVIKDGNLNDLYIKYRDRIIESVEESIERDKSVADRKVRPPS